MNLISLLDVQDSIKVSLKDLHPKQIISELILKATVYEVSYEYTTNRGNRREGLKYFILQTLNPQIDMKLKLSEWVKKYNIENKHRQLLNVNILNSKCLGYTILK